jgi:amidase
MSGSTPVDPTSLEKPAVSFVDAVAARKAPKRVAFSRDLGGITPVDPEVAAIVEKAARKFEDMGCIVEEACPDFTDVQMIFQTLRAMAFAASKKELLATHRDKLKPEVIWNIEKGLSLTMEEISAAELARGRYYHRVREFYQTYDLVLCPATVVPPYSIEQRFVEECQGHKFSNYIEWCTVAYAFTCASVPAISVPAGFTAGGLPVGLQIAGGPARAEGLRPLQTSQPASRQNAICSAENADRSRSRQRPMPSGRMTSAQAGSSRSAGTGRCKLPTSRVSSSTGRPAKSSKRSG